MCVAECMCVHDMCVGICRWQDRESIPLELELEVVSWCHVCVEIQPRTCERASMSPNCWAISSDPQIYLMLKLWFPTWYATRIALFINFFVKIPSASYWALRLSFDETGLTWTFEVQLSLGIYYRVALLMARWGWINAIHHPYSQSRKVSYKEQNQDSLSKFYLLRSEKSKLH